MEKYIKSEKEMHDFYIAFFLFTACILSYLENFIPKPLPGIKLGLANSIVIIFIIYSKYKAAVFISIFKVIIVSLFAGYILSPPFFLGLTGSVFSSITMIAVFVVFKKKVSPLGISVIGAFMHINAQLLIAYFLIPGLKDGIFFLAGILILTSVISGILTGLFTIYLLKKL